MGTYPPVHASDRPKMKNKLDSTVSVALSNWICGDLVDYDRSVSQFRLANPCYVPTLSKWVTPETWVRISEDMLDPEDKTEGGPPNDLAVEAFLRSEGKYEGRRKHGGKIIQGNVKQRLETLVYETKSSHIKAYEQYMDPWNKIVIPLRDCENPHANFTAKIILAAIQPKTLRSRITAKVWDGLEPEYLSDKFEGWRQKVKTDTRLLRNLIRENADYWDRMGLKDKFASWGTHSSTYTSTTSEEAPQCEVIGCITNNVRRKRVRYGGDLFKMCENHREAKIDERIAAQTGGGAGGSENNTTPSNSEATRAEEVTSSKSGVVSGKKK